MGTKNNPKNRVKNVEKKKFKGKEVEPIYYYGVRVGHGKYKHEPKKQKMTQIPWKIHSRQENTLDSCKTSTEDAKLMYLVPYKSYHIYSLLLAII